MTKRSEKEAFETMSREQLCVFCPTDKHPADVWYRWEEGFKNEDS